MAINVTLSTYIASEEQFSSATALNNATGNQAIYGLTAIPSEESFTPVAVDNLTGTRVVIGTGVIPSGESFYTPALGTALTDQFVYASSYIASAESFYTPILTYPQDVTVTSYIASAEAVYDPTLNGIRVTSYIASAENFRALSISTNVDISPTVIDESQMYFPSIGVGAITIQPNAVIPSAESIPTPTVQPGNLNLTVAAPLVSSEYFYTPRIDIPQARPVVLRLASSGMNGGGITQNNIAPRLSYYSIPATTPITYDQMVYTESLGLVPDYISSSDALFSGQFYTGFYVYNASPFGNVVGKMQNLHLWINGGESFTVTNSATPRTVMYENTPYLDKMNSKYGVGSTTNYDFYNKNGSSNTSMLNQVNVELFVSPTQKLVEFDDAGFSIGLNLARQRFSPANEKIKLPDLLPGEYVSIYMRITTQFQPNLGIPNDYSFMHLSYTSGEGNVRESYPGQLTSVVGGTAQTLFLPSVVLKFVTNYDKILKDVDNESNTLYGKYPPYFMYYEGNS